MLTDLDATALYEGVETEAEFDTLRGNGGRICSRGITLDGGCSRGRGVEGKRGRSMIDIEE